MPNWCENYLRIEGSKENLDAFEDKLWTEENYSEKLESLKAKTLTGTVFQRIRSRKLHSEIVRMKDCPGLFDSTMFCYHDQLSEALWGTRTDTPVNEDFVRVSEIVITFTFDTAWYPPLKWLEQMAVDFPDLEMLLAYYEGGNTIAGYATTVNGEMHHKAAGNSDEFRAIGEVYFGIDNYDINTV